MRGTHFERYMHAMDFAAMNCSEKKLKKFHEQIESFTFVGVVIVKFY